MIPLHDNNDSPSHLNERWQQREIDRYDELYESAEQREQMDWFNQEQNFLFNQND